MAVKISIFGSVAIQYDDTKYDREVVNEMQQDSTFRVVALRKKANKLITVQILNDNVVNIEQDVAAIGSTITTVGTHTKITLP